MDEDDRGKEKPFLSFPCRLFEIETMAVKPKIPERCSVLSLHLSSCTTCSLTPIRVQLHWTAQAQFAGYYSAASFGYFEDECLSVTVVAGGPGYDPVEELTSGRSQFANLWAATALASREAGTRLVTVSQLWQSSSLVCVSWKSSGLSNPSHWPGHTVGVWDSNGLATEVRVLGREYGVSEKNYTEVAQGFTVSPLFDGSIEVISATTYNELSQILETVNTETQDTYKTSDLYILRLADSGVVIVEDSVVVTEEFLAQNETIVKAFLKALTRGWLKCRLDPESCVSLLPTSDDHQRWMMNEVNRMLWLFRGQPFGVPTSSAWDSTLSLCQSVSTTNHPLNSSVYTGALNTTLQRSVVQELSDEGYDVYGFNYTYTQFSWCLKCKAGSKATLCQTMPASNKTSTTLITAISVPFGILALAVTAISIVLLLKLKEARNRVQQLEDEIDKHANFSVVGAPAQKAIDSLIRLKKKHWIGTSDHDELSRVISLIASNRLYNADMLEESLQAKKVDAEVDAFLVDLLVKHDKANPLHLPESSTTSSIMTILVEADPSISTDSLFKSIGDSRATNAGWDFDIFSMAPNSMLSPLEMIGLALLEEFGLVSYFHLDVRTLVSFLRRLCSGYSTTNPYHNALHAADVTQAMGVLLFQYQKSAQAQHCSAATLSPMELLCAVVAALIHDFAHPGVNNNFITATMHEIGLQHNFISPLENMHASEALQLLLRKENNFLTDLPSNEYLEFHRNVVTLVLATDMTRHIEITGQVTAKLSTTSTGAKSSIDHLLLLQIMLKFADISAPSRKWPQCERWATFVQNEFYSQGDKERVLGLTISPGMDRTTTNWPKCQATFIKYVVQPLADLMDQMINLETLGIKENLKDNEARWMELDHQ
ncbi:calcium calmodulin-dependent 3 -cyclic nucleotide phosphodiesterase 1b [Pelomyxa schiedti]|nr:calcium calmodulin-dependent 3 -cyclic nucleotide phosphodiesterase 1b [Pelomyxa schiedti]